MKNHGQSVYCRGKTKGRRQTVARHDRVGAPCTKVSVRTIDGRRCEWHATKGFRRWISTTEEMT